VLWISSLKDIRGVQRIEARLTNLQKGNFGVARSVGGEVMVFFEEPEPLIAQLKKEGV
jgi:putative component of toxin-antitoxin plasmid stabilization module